MRINDEQEKKPIPRELLEWRALHPEFTDTEFDEALVELRAYLRLAWTVYKAQHSNLDLPDSL